MGRDGGSTGCRGVAGRDVFRAGDAENRAFAGLTPRGPETTVEKAMKGLALHA